METFEVQHDSANNCTVLLFRVPLPVEKEAQGRSAEWLEPIKKKIAELAKGPEFVRVAALEQRRAAAETALMANKGRIAELEASATAYALAENDILDRTLSEIEECKRAIGRAELIVKAVDQALPAAREAREEAASAGIEAATAKELAKISEKVGAAPDALLEAVFRGYVAMRQGQGRLSQLRELERGGAALVLHLSSPEDNGE